MTENEPNRPPLIAGDSPQNNPSFVKSSSNSFVPVAIERLSNADPANVQQIAASQIELLSNYHQEVLDQAEKSFNSALIAAGAAFVFFLGTLGFVIFSDSNKKIEIAMIGTISGALIELISGINFYLYGRASAQMADFQQRLDKTQRFLLANSICEGLEGQEKQKARSELVRAIAEIVSSSDNMLSPTKKDDTIEQESP